MIIGHLPVILHKSREQTDYIRVPGPVFVASAIAADHDILRHDSLPPEDLPPHSSVYCLGSVPAFPFLCFRVAASITQSPRRPAAFRPIRGGGCADCYFLSKGEGIFRLIRCGWTRNESG